MACSLGRWEADSSLLSVHRAPATYEGQWTRDGADIPGATKPSYTPSASGSYACRVTAANRAGATSQVSDPISVVGAATLSAAPLSRAFGTREADSGPSAAQSFTVENTGRWRSASAALCSKARTPISSRSPRTPASRVGTCSGAVKVRTAKRVRVGRGKKKRVLVLASKRYASIAAGTTGTAKVRLKAKARRLLKKAGKVRIVISLSQPSASPANARASYTHATPPCPGCEETHGLAADLPPARQSRRWGSPKRSKAGAGQVRKRPCDESRTPPQPRRAPLGRPGRCP